MDWMRSASRILRRERKDGGCAGLRKKCWKVARLSVRLSMIMIGSPVSVRAGVCSRYANLSCDLAACVIAGAKQRLCFLEIIHRKRDD